MRNNNKFDQTYSKLKKLEIIAIVGAILIFLFGMIVSGMLIHKSQTKSDASRPRTTKHVKTVKSKPAVSTDNTDYKSNGYKYLFEGRIQPIVDNSKNPEYPSGQFKTTYAAFIDNSFKGRYDTTISTMKNLRKHYQFTNDNDLLLVGMYRDAEHVAKLAAKTTNTDKGNYIKDSLIMPESLVAMNQQTIYQVKQHFLLDPESLAPVDENKYVYDGMLHFTDKKQAGKVPALAEGNNPVSDIYDKYDDKVSSIYQLKVTTKNFNDSVAMYSYVVEFTNGKTALYGTYYDDTVKDTKNAEERPLTFFTKNKDLQQIYKNAKENQAKRYNDMAQESDK